MSGLLLKATFWSEPVYSMNILKEKALKLAESIRKQERQDMMISRRNWH